ncbi:hypothetical protein NC653_021244 [Populus alba x Populus x berolinensis]|uniref:Uncharacterized protein n=1 Tax=Populus alba x Populus x berolinensis TaxID=444605 RepID=A0AAD6QDE5_9ROSI|nr:hypothetical protein NC653_021244 [Populus alba x Populus x berolinensis]
MPSTCQHMLPLLESSCLWWKIMNASIL